MELGSGNLINQGYGAYRRRQVNWSIPGEMRERNETKLEEAAAHLSVDEKTVRRMIRSGMIPARLACKGAPWVIGATALPACVQDIAPALSANQEALDLQ